RSVRAAPAAPRRRPFLGQKVGCNRRLAVAAGEPGHVRPQGGLSAHPAPPPRPGSSVETGDADHRVGGRRLVRLPRSGGAAYRRSVDRRLRPPPLRPLLEAESLETLAVNQPSVPPSGSAADPGMAGRFPVAGDLPPRGHPVSLRCAAGRPRRRPASRVPVLGGVEARIPRPREPGICPPLWRKAYTLREASRHRDRRSEQAAPLAGVVLHWLDSNAQPGLCPHLGRERQPRHQPPSQEGGTRSRGVAVAGSAGSDVAAFRAAQVLQLVPRRPPLLFALPRLRRRAFDLGAVVFRRSARGLGPGQVHAAVEGGRTGARRVHRRHAWRPDQNQYIYMRIPGVSFGEWHPFSLCRDTGDAGDGAAKVAVARADRPLPGREPPKGNSGDFPGSTLNAGRPADPDRGGGGGGGGMRCRVYVRARGPFPCRLLACTCSQPACGNYGESAKPAVRPAFTSLEIDGPYGRPSFDPRRYSTNVVVAGGIGAAPMLGWVQWILEDPRRPARSKVIWVWVAKSAG
ncbi:MAG: hypothetical protein BJ554DRAFT_7673, partial [Olpidium bornovanus]